MVDYLGDEDLRTLLLRKTGNAIAPKVTTVMSLAELEQMQTQVQKLPFSSQVVDSLVELQREFKKENFVASTRKYVQMVMILRAYAFLQGETEVSEDSFEILNHVIWNHPREKTAIAEKTSLGNARMFSQEIRDQFNLLRALDRELHIISLLYP
jgi:MoxR-like ATPase